MKNFAQVSSVSKNYLTGPGRLFPSDNIVTRFGRKQDKLTINIAKILSYVPKWRAPVPKVSMKVANMFFQLYERFPMSKNLLLKATLIQIDFI